MSKGIVNQALHLLHMNTRRYNMKRLIALVLFAALLLSSAALADTIKPSMDLTVAKPSFTANNPVIEGEDPITGLKITDPDAVFTPILLVLDGSEGSYPHWGVEAASAIIQVPNQSTTQTKLVALYTTQFPNHAGGSRSARMPALVWANVFNSAFVSAGAPPIDEGDSCPVSVHYWRKQWGLKNNYSKEAPAAERKYYNMLGNDSLKERTPLLPEPHNMLISIAKIHEELIANGVPFEMRPFLFTDEPLTRGKDATTITMDYSNNAANCTYIYNEAIGGYRRKSQMGKETERVFDFNYDRETENTLIFSNVIVIRAKFKFDSSTGTGYPYAADNFTGSGWADIFQSGHYIRGSWYRDGLYGRLIIMDEDGNELKFQRGVTFFTFCNEKCVISYE